MTLNRRFLRPQKQKLPRQKKLIYLSIGLLSFIALIYCVTYYIIGPYYGWRPIYHKHRIELPNKIYECGEVKQSHYFGNVYVAYMKTDSAKLYPRFLYDDVTGSVSDLSSYYSISCRQSTDPHPGYPVLGIDKDVPMILVDSIKSELASFTNFAYFLVRNSSNTFSYYYTNKALPINLTLWQHMKLKEHKTPPLAPLFDTIPNKNDTVILCQIGSDGSYKINQTKLGNEELTETIQSLLSAISDNAFIIKISTKATFESYANLLGSIHQARLLALAKSQNVHDLENVNLRSKEYRFRIYE